MATRQEQRQKQRESETNAHTHIQKQKHTHKKHAHTYTYTYTHVQARQLCESFKLLAFVVCGAPSKNEGTQVRSSSEGRTGSVFNEKEIIVNST